MVFSQHEAFIKKESTWGTGVDPTSTTTALAEVLGATTNIDYRIENTVGAVNPAEKIDELITARKKKDGRT
ncbi:MAG TPA: hypothetical protein PLJ66_05425 [Methanofastidiosum sp.]|nr:hypothetical protein [Methanofastidiosum sp.]